jgi:hypothetical protein
MPPISTVNMRLNLHRSKLGFYPRIFVMGMNTSMARALSHISGLNIFKRSTG